jgi:hypothetical protein
VAVVCIMYVNTSCPVVEPPGVVIRMSTGPAERAGDVAMMVLALTTVKLVAGIPPNVTAVAPSRLAPVMVTVVPPTAGPLFGPIDVTFGAGVT